MKRKRKGRVVDGQFLLVCRLVVWARNSLGATPDEALESLEKEFGCKTSRVTERVCYSLDYLRSHNVGTVWMRTDGATEIFVNEGCFMTTVVFYPNAVMEVDYNTALLTGLVPEDGE